MIYDWKHYCTASATFKRVFWGTKLKFPAFSAPSYFFFVFLDSIPVGPPHFAFRGFWKLKLTHVITDKERTIQTHSYSMYAFHNSTSPSVRKSFKIHDAQQLEHTMPVNVRLGSSKG